MTNPDNVKCQGSRVYKIQNTGSITRGDHSKNHAKTWYCGEGILKSQRLTFVSQLRMKDTPEGLKTVCPYMRSGERPTLTERNVKVPMYTKCMHNTGGSITRWDHSKNHAKTWYCGEGKGTQLGSHEHKPKLRKSHAERGTERT